MGVVYLVGAVVLLCSVMNLVCVVQNEQTFGQLVGGARTYYSFELFLEIRKEGEKFQKYGRGGEISYMTLATIVIKFLIQLKRASWDLWGGYTTCTGGASIRPCP